MGAAGRAEGANALLGGSPLLAVKTLGRDRRPHAGSLSHSRYQLFGGPALCGFVVTVLSSCPRGPPDSLLQLRSPRLEGWVPRRLALLGHLFHTGLSRRKVVHLNHTKRWRSVKRCGCPPCHPAVTDAQSPHITALQWGAGHSSPSPPIRAPAKSSGWPCISAAQPPFGGGGSGIHNL